MIVFQTFLLYWPRPEQDLREATSLPTLSSPHWGGVVCTGCSWGGPTQTTATVAATGETQIPSCLTAPPTVTPTSEAIPLVNVFPDLHLLPTLAGPSLHSARSFCPPGFYNTAYTRRLLLQRPTLTTPLPSHLFLSPHTPSSSKTSKSGIHRRKHRKSNQALRNRSNPDCGSQPIMDLKATVSVKWVRTQNVEALSPDHKLAEPLQLARFFIVYKNPIKHTVLQELSATASSKGGEGGCVYGLNWMWRFKVTEMYFSWLQILMTSSIMGVGSREEGRERKTDREKLEWVEV